jgi:two-component sensor histidine kinase
VTTQRPNPDSITEDLLPVPHAARHARDMVTEACVRWDLEHLTAPAALIATELVGNVIDHAHTMMTLEISRDRYAYLRLAVHDGSHLPPVLRRGWDVTSPNGLGLRLVDFSSSAWGFTREAGGKAVWATLSPEVGAL